MADMKDKLEALLANKGVMRGSDWRAKLDRLERERAEGAYEIETAVDGEIAGGEDDGFYLVRTDYPLDTVHGVTTLGAALDTLPEHVALAAADDSLVEFNPRTALFMDTETTGLAGGAGTTAFLIGAGYFTGDVFRLEQCFMRDYEDEEPMLAYLDGLFRGRETVVSYNGKSFDVPLLRTRFIQNRIPCRLDAMLQYDLVHAARRFWKRRLRDCSLGNIEREVLRVERHGDVPSAEIPQRYFDYLRTRDARPLQGVFYHHRMDILSLVTLTAWLSRCIGEPEGRGFEHVEDLASRVWVHFRQRDYESVIELGARVLEQTGEGPLRHGCLECMGIAQKRLRRWDEMEETWSLLMREAPTHLRARQELAILYEHRTRDLEQARRICQETVDLLETRRALGRDSGESASALPEFTRRLDRVVRKLGRLDQSGTEDRD